MNARQKAKKYKRELDQLRNTSINIPRITVETPRVETFVVKQIFDLNRAYSVPPAEIVRKMLMDDITHNPDFQKCVEFVDYFDPITCQVMCEARINVVVRNKEE